MPVPRGFERVLQSKQPAGHPHVPESAWGDQLRRGKCPEVAARIPYRVTVAFAPLPPTITAPRCG